MRRSGGMRRDTDHTDDRKENMDDNISESLPFASKEESSIDIGKPMEQYAGRQRGLES